MLAVSQGNVICPCHLLLGQWWKGGNETTNLVSFNCKALQLSTCKQKALLPSLHCCTLWAMCPGSASCHRLKPGVDWRQQSGWRLIHATLWNCTIQQCGLQGWYSCSTAERTGVNCQRYTHVIANVVRDCFIWWAVSADMVILWWTGVTVQLLGFILQQCVCNSPWEIPELVFNWRAWWALAGMCVLTQDGESGLLHVWGVLQSFQQ